MPYYVREREHKKISAFLKEKYFENFAKSSTLLKAVHENLIEDYLEAFFRSFGRSQGVISERIEKKGINISSSSVSRFTKELNQILGSYCKTTKFIDPPIQLFFSTKENIQFGCHFACSKPAIIKKISIRNGHEVAREFICSDKIIPLEDAQKNIDHRLIKFKGHLKEEAKSHLNEKLHGRDDYKQLNVEILVDSKRDTAEEKKQKIWISLEYKNLLRKKVVYFLSSEAGTGKTTFLRKLQLDILKENGLIPLFLNASDIDKIQIYENNPNSFLKTVTEKYYGFFTEFNLENLLKDFSEKMFFLIDGVDQVSEINHDLLDKLIKVTNGKLLVSSRPYVFANLDRNKETDFLRLTPFKSDDIKGYFGSNYERASKMCRTCQELLEVPMLCYMVRWLIENDQAEKFSYRKDIYERFGKAILLGNFSKELNYKHENLKFAKGKRYLIKQAYELIAFKAMDEGNYLQKIPFDFAVKCLHQNGFRIEIDDIFKLGLTNIINCEDEEYLSFTHLSFQEYWAAEHLSKDRDLVSRFLNKKWNPKWIGVIKFLVGIKGEELVKKILSQTKLSYRFKLILVAECVKEAFFSKELLNKISSEIKQQIAIRCYYDRFLERSLICVDQKQAVDRFDKLLSCDSLESNSGKSTYISWSLEDLLAYKDILKAETIERIDDLTYKFGYDRFRIEDLVNIIQLIDTIRSSNIGKIAQTIIDFSENDYWYPMFDGNIIELDYLENVRNKISNQQINKIFQTCYSYENNGLDAYWAVQKLGRILDNDNPRLLYGLVDILNKGSEAAICSALKVFTERRCILDDRVFKVIDNFLDNDDSDIVAKTIQLLGSCSAFPNKKIIQKIISKITDKPFIAMFAIEAIANLTKKGILHPKQSMSMFERLESDEPDVIISVLKAIVNLKDHVQITDDIFKLVLSKLDSHDKYVACEAIKTIINFKDHELVDYDILEKIVDKILSLDEFCVTGSEAIDPFLEIDFPVLLKKKIFEKSVGALGSDNTFIKKTAAKFIIQICDASLQSSPAVVNKLIMVIGESYQFDYFSKKIEKIKFLIGDNGVKQILKRVLEETHFGPSYVDLFEFLNNIKGLKENKIFFDDTMKEKMRSIAEDYYQNNPFDTLYIFDDLEVLIE